MQDADQIETNDKPLRWRFNDPALLYLFPASYLLHLIEEAVARAPVLMWYSRIEHAAASPAFVLGNSFALGLMLASIRLVGRSARFDWIVAALATAVLLNTAGHVVGSVLYGTYSAGLLSAGVLWVPLGLLTLFRAFEQTSMRTFRIGVAVGTLVEIVVVGVSAVLNLLEAPSF
jgi:hypothetical protein